jgi:L-fuculose-phosphate aldolase
VDCPLQENENAPSASIEIFPEFNDAATNIKAGDELLVFTWLGLGDRSVLKTFPRNDPKNGMRGVSSTRSPHRPNPIGIHVVEVTAVQGDGIIQVAALEVLDKTLVLDIKSK